VDVNTKTADGRATNSRNELKAVEAMKKKLHYMNGSG
jgi:hypothetical protein